jgi:coenzyme F420-reducing hydrogenase beta subunit
MNFLIRKILKKTWNEKDILDMVGSYQEVFTGYALENRIRFGGASGGLTTAILTYAFDCGLIDGVLVCRTIVTDENCVRAQFYIAKNREDLFDSQGSHYVRSKFVPEALNLIEEFKGKLAVVGLPCDLAVLSRKMHKNSRWLRKIEFTIGLFCGHNSTEHLIDNVVKKLKPRRVSRLERFRFRTGLWRGYSLARFKSDKIVEKKFSYFSLYQNLYFFCQKKCLYCHDHFAYNADISVGDIWSFHLKTHKIKYNSIISRSDRGSEILSACKASGYIQLEGVQIEDVLDGQSRGAPTHNNTSAKSKAAVRFGMKIPDKHKQKVKLHQLIAAWIILFNYKWSCNENYAGYIFKMPRKLLQLYLLVLKGLESVK